MSKMAELSAMRDQGFKINMPANFESFEASYNPEWGFMATFYFDSQEDFVSFIIETTEGKTRKTDKIIVGS